MPQKEFIDGFQRRPRRRRSAGSVPAASSPAPARVPAPVAPRAAQAAPANGFPEVGMTLRAYKYNAFDSNPTSQRHLKPVVKQGRLSWFKRHVGWKRAILTVVIAGLLVGGWVGGKFLYNAHKVFGGSIFGFLHGTKLKGEDSGRVNILLAGNSADDPGHDGANLTDSIMVISINVKDNSAFMLSIPRDMWVDIPDDGSAKINSAYVVGQEDDFSSPGYPDGGMGQLEQIISEDFGINIDYYALINYEALKDAVNDVGGINFTVHSSDPRGLYDPSIDYSTHGPLVKLSNGTHVLNGEQALDLARARGDAYGSYGFAGSDFERTQNQREMLIAIKNKVTSTGFLANPAKLTSLADTFGSNVKTDMNSSEVRRLYDIGKQINSNQIQSLSLNDAGGKNLLASYTAPDGESALVPAAGADNYYDIQNFINQQMSNNPIVREGATIVVLNGTDVNGLATKQESKLEDTYNLNVGAVGDARSAQTTTSIIDASDGKMPNTRKLLGKIYGQHFTTSNPYAGIYNADFIVVIGNDQIPKSTPAVGD